jgi:cleavage and polyadenylation specificity factor subunit 1
VSNSTRVYINDLRSGKLFLIDTGAEISVIPHNHSARQLSDVHLTAANSTRIKTFGPKTLNIDLGLSRAFPWTFETTDVSRAIIGADFLHYFGLLVDVRRHCLVDPTDKRTVTCAVTSTTSTNAPLFAVAHVRGWYALLQDFVICIYY